LFLCGHDIQDYNILCLDFNPPFIYCQPPFLLETLMMQSLAKKPRGVRSPSSSCICDGWWPRGSKWWDTSTKGRRGGADPSVRRLSLQRLRIRNTAAGVVHCLPRGSQCSQRSKVSCIGHCLLQGIWIGRRRLGAQINPTGAEHRRTAYASCRPCFHSEQYQLNTTSNPTAKQDFRNRQKTNW